MLKASVQSTGKGKITLNKALYKVLERVYKDLEDCREVLPLLPLMSVLQDGRSGWGGPITDGRLLCKSDSGHPDIFLDCGTGRYVDRNGRDLPNKELLRLVTSNFDLKAVLRGWFEGCLKETFHGYDVEKNRAKKASNVGEALKLATSGIKNLFKL